MWTDCVLTHLVLRGKYEVFFWQAKIISKNHGFSANERRRGGLGHPVNKRLRSAQLVKTLKIQERS